ncbi:MAG TPA: hypothetical protein VI893_06850 [Thermoplasmata archaeon]|nr:hypothetical protein [Thermoplasmata archaeon]
MTPVTRLSTISAGLADAFQRAPEANRKRATAFACEYAVKASVLSGREIEEGLDVLRASKPASRELAVELDRLVSQLDDAYLSLADAPDERSRKESMVRFSRARAASALTIALAGDQANLHEAIYEAVASVEDPSELLRLVREALGE